MRIPLEPIPGLIGNDTSFSQQMRYTDASNVRWVGGRAETIGGWALDFPDQLTGVCRNVHAWRDLNGSVNIAFGTHLGLYVYVNGALYDITPSGLSAGSEDSALGPGYGTGSYGEGEYGEGDTSDYFARTWSLQNWGQNLIASPRGGTIYIWENDTGTAATAITNAPDQVTAVVVTPERQIIALGCNEYASPFTFNPMVVRGSKLQDYDDWTPSPTTSSFERVLEAAGGGRIVGARMVGSYLMVWTDLGMFLGEFTGDTDVYRFDLVDTHCGLAGPNAVTTLNGQAWWWSPENSFYSWTPGIAPLPVPCPIRDDFKDRVAEGQQDKIVAVSIGERGEIWWFYPDSRDGYENSRGVFVKPEANAVLWSKTDMARSAACDAGSVESPLFVSPEGYVYAHENGNSANGDALAWSLTISLLYLDEGGRFVLLKGLEPDIKDQLGAVSLAFDLRKYPQSDPVSKGPYTLAPNTPRKHFLISGRIADVTFSGSTAPTFARFGKPILLGEATGQE